MNENRGFLDNQLKHTKIERGGCCHSVHTRNCCFFSCLLGAVLLLLGVVFLATGQMLLMKVVLSTMPLKPGTDRYQSWLSPPVQPHLTGYAFNVTNPEEVMNGEKPILQEVGPFVYKAVTVKDSRDNIEVGEETLTYKPRKFYFIDLEQSIGDPDTTFIIAPNIPLISALSDYKDKSGYGKNAAVELITNEGRGTPFINVSFSGLLWGYEDSLPCFKMDIPGHCPKPEQVEMFEEDFNIDFDDDEDWKRKKRSAAEDEAEAAEEEVVVKKGSSEVSDLRNGPFESWEKPKGGFVNCTCNWGLFRDRNVTLRKPVTIYHGMSDLSKKGWVKEFDSSPVMNWWEKGSKCDELGGYDGGTLPPGLDKEDSLDIFISLMCRRLELVYEKEMQYQNNLTANRYIPPENAMGSHLDENPRRKNPDNKCYCVENFKCFKSGVLNMAPCKRTPDRPTGAPMALSYPHFYQADPSYLEAVEGLNPDKDRHQFYVDLQPDLGFPLAIRPRFQLNLVISRDEDIPIMSKFPEELVLPFLWAQDGFDRPSEEMAHALRRGLDIPHKYSRLLGVVLLALGGGLLISSVVWILWKQRTTRNQSTIPSM